MSTLIAIAAFLMVGAIMRSVVVRARDASLGRGSVQLLAAICILGLLVMTISDWPSESLAGFWSEHSVLSAIASTLLLVGAGFLLFEAADLQSQQRLGDSLSSAGFAGMVDHVVDVDLALSLLAMEPRSSHYRDDGKPLRWMRELKRECFVQHGFADPRLAAPGPLIVGAWQDDLLDQCVRRVMAGLRDWSPLLCQTREGTAIAVRLGNLRLSLLDLQQALRVDTADERTLWRNIRAECQVLALGLEVAGGATHLRLEILESLVLDVADATADEFAELCRHKTRKTVQSRRDATRQLAGVPERSLLDVGRSVLAKVRS